MGATGPVETPAVHLGRAATGHPNWDRGHSCPHPWTRPQHSGGRSKVELSMPSSARPGPRTLLSAANLPPRHTLQCRRAPAVHCVVLCFAVNTILLRPSLRSGRVYGRGLSAHATWGDLGGSDPVGGKGPVTLPRWRWRHRRYTSTRAAGRPSSCGQDTYGPLATAPVYEELDPARTACLMLTHQGVGHRSRRRSLPHCGQECPRSRAMAGRRRRPWQRQQRGCGTPTPNQTSACPKPPHVAWADSPRP